MKWLFLFGVLCLATACFEKKEPVWIERLEETITEIDEQEEEREKQRVLDSLTEARMEEVGLVNIRKMDARIKVDLRYAGSNNFMHKQLYDTLHQAFVQRDVAERLSKVQDYLDSIRPGYRLLVFDAVRPVQVQREMWEALDSIPPLNRGKFVSNPALGSVHNFGAAVDLTIVDEMGKELDMGAGYDDFRKIAFPSMEGHFLQSGELSKAQWENRKLLRQVMRSQRFSNIPSEWWHFNATSRIGAAHKYQLLVTESGSWRRMTIVETRDTISDSLINPE